MREDGSRMERVPGSRTAVTDRAIAEKKKATSACRRYELWKRAQGSVKLKNLDRARGDRQECWVLLVGSGPQIKCALQDCILG